MPQRSLLGTAARCGIRPPLSVMQDIMLYGAYQTASLGKVLVQMDPDCTLDADAAGALIEFTGSASITAVNTDVAGLNHTIRLDVTLTNLTKGTVNIDQSELLLTDSGGAVLDSFAMFGQNTVLENAVLPLQPGSVQTGSKMDFNWGGGPFDFVVSMHASTLGARQHLLRHIPILRSGFANPPNLATPSPVFVGLWNRPVEVVVLDHGGGATQWLTVAGHIVNMARKGVAVTIDSLHFQVLSELQLLADLPAPNWFFRQSDGHLVPPNPDGRVPLTEALATFVFGTPVQVWGVRPTLRVELLYTMTEAGQDTEGKAVSVLPLSFAKPTLVSAPVATPPAGIWNWGNAPDHMTFTDPNGSPTGPDSHARPGERYCYDITMVQVPGGPTFSGTCVNLANGKHAGDCTDNAKFFAYGKPVFAAKAGTAALVQDGLPDNFGFDANPNTISGNFVVVDHGDGTFAGYFHVQPGSILVSTAPGKNSVAAGQKIAAVGNSGGSSEPHLHFGYAVVHPTGRAVIAPVNFTNLRELDNSAVTVVPGNGLYRS